MTERRVPLDLTTPCLPWPGAVQPHGYARIEIDGEVKYVHRLTYQLMVGPIPRGWEIDHACHNGDPPCTADPCPHRACWNPGHLESVSSAENSRRGNHPLFAASRRLVCLAGLHDLTDDANAYTLADGRRRCRPCATSYQQQRRERVSSRH